MRYRQRIIERFWFPVTEEQLKKGKINVFDLSNGLSSVELFRNEHGITTDSNVVQVDTLQICPIISVLRRYTTSIYFHLLKELKDNRRAVLYNQTKLRNDATNIGSRVTFNEYLEELCESGLVFRFKSHEFYINPLFAWVGDRSRYFDVDRMPFKPSDVCTDESE